MGHFVMKCSAPRRQPKRTVTYTLLGCHRPDKLFLVDLECLRGQHAPSESQQQKENDAQAKGAEEARKATEARNKVTMFGMHEWSYIKASEV